MRTPIERETALIFAAALLMQDVVHNKALDRPARRSEERRVGKEC